MSDVLRCRNLGPFGQCWNVAEVSVVMSLLRTTQWVSMCGHCAERALRDRPNVARTTGPLEMTARQDLAA